MNSEFNTVFNTTINEFVATADAAKSMIGHKPLYDKQSKTANTSAASANTDTLSSTTQQFKDHNGGIVKNLMQAAPSVLKTLQAQSKLWNGKANIGLSELAEMIKGYNEKQALNAMYGIIDYAKSKKPTLIMQDNDMIKTIKQQLLQKQNEKQ